MPKLVKEEMYVKSNAAGNNNKFWEIKLYDDFSVHIRNGRIGGSGEIQKPKEYGSMEEAESFWNKKTKEKLSPRKGYTKFKGILTESNEVKVTSSNNLADIALKQIVSASGSETAKLIKYLSDKNIHNITSATTITYNADSGLFKTPLGIVTQEGIDEARILLGKIAPFVKKASHTDSQFIDYLQEYMRLIPRKIGRKFIPEEIISDMNAIQAENQILDSLDASLQKVLSAPVDDGSGKKTTDESKIFNVKVEVLADTKVFDYIVQLFNKTRDRNHTSYNLKPKKVYTVEIAHMKEAFEKKGKLIGNIWELYHGTKTANLLSILKGGLVIPKGNESHVTGAMFSTGLYFSDNSTKSLNYSQGYWSGGSRDSNPFMFLCDVAMGKHYVPSRPSNSLPMKGYDSTFAKAHHSGVINNEMVIYKTAQCNLKYLIEFSSH
jgi:poly [ADP-ribose] polymerase